MVNLLVLGVFCVRKRRFLAPLLFLLPILLIHMPWMLYQRYGLSEFKAGEILGSFASPSNFSWGRLAILVKLFGRFVADMRLFGLSWILFFLVAAIGMKSSKGHGYLLAMTCLGIAAWFAIFSISRVGEGKSYELFIHQSGDRLLLNYIPLIVYYSARSRVMRDLFRAGVLRKVEDEKFAVV